MVESGIGLFAACLPVLRALVKDFVIPAIKRLRSLVFGSSISSKHSRLPEHTTDRRQALDDELIKESKTSSSGVAESHCEDVEAILKPFQSSAYGRYTSKLLELLEPSFSDASKKE
ncbi:MAG: hypothetical protein Q9190_003180 [Brigantiaea leucoxantha]